MKLKPKRQGVNQEDFGSIEAHSYNEPAGSRKIIVVDPVVKKAVTGAENVGFGRYVKVTGTSYTLDCVGKVYDAGATYRQGDIVTSGAFIYMATEDNITGAFDAGKWQKVADKQIGPVTITAGAVVCTGRWHNTVSVDGFLVDDESHFSPSRR